MRGFSTSVDGYDKEEVNKFVSDVTVEYESMLNKLKARDEEIQRLKEQLEQYKGLEVTMNKAMLMAEDSSNQIRKIAKEEADNIISNAKKNASYIVNDALIKAEKIETETDQLRRSLKIYKTRIKAAIEEQLTFVDDVDKISIDEKK